MDPSRTPLSPGGRKRRRVESPSTELPAGGHQQTSLPSIRQLHPYLPPSGMPQPMSSEGASYGYSAPSSYASQPTQFDPSGSSHPMTTLQQIRDPVLYGVPESEADDVEQQSPPKKKRRRQALSCTECKRRKIKCDRIQPCTPCTRRGEEAGCQWHIVEPVEKYVTRAEFDELKARFEQLVALVQRIMPTTSTSTGLPYFQMNVQQTMSGPETVSAYNPGTPGSMGYPSMMAPPSQQPQSYAQHMDPSTSQAGRYIKPEEAQASGRQMHQPSLGAGVGPSTPPIMPTNLHNPSTSSRHRDQSPTSAAAAIKSSPLSLSSITAPYHPDHGLLQVHHAQQQQQQPKNYHAQTLKLGERLRPGSEDPLNSFAMTHPHPRLLWSFLRHLGVTPPRCLSRAAHLVHQVHKQLLLPLSRCNNLDHRVDLTLGHICTFVTMREIA